MLLSTAEDLAKFVEELKHETDRGLPLVAAALIDDRLAETLRSFFCEVPSVSKLIDEGNSPLSTFSSRTEASRAEVDEIIPLDETYFASSISAMKAISSAIDKQVKAGSAPA